MKVKKSEIVDKDKISAKEFIRMKRGQIKEANVNTDIFQKLKSLIASANHEEFGATICKNKPELVMTFLFTENETKHTPLMVIINDKSYSKLLAEINKWCLNNSKLVDSCLQNGQNELKIKDWRLKYLNLNKCIAQTLTLKLTQKRDVDQVIKLLGQQEGIFFKLANKFMTIDEIILFIGSFKTTHDILKDMYLNLLSNTPLKTKKGKLLQEVQQYHHLILQEKIWKSNDYLNIIKSLSKQNISLLKLQQLDYNFWHELALTDPNQFFNILHIVSNKLQQNEELYTSVTQMLMEFDRGCQTPIDKCLRAWPYQSIQKFLLNHQNINNLMLTTNSLNKILANRKLSQQQKENLIVQCLQGKISKKGYLKMMPIKINHKLKTSTSVRQLQVHSFSNTFSICYDKNLLKKQKDNANSYPLVIYLNLYKDKVSLKIIQLLFFEQLAKKKVKKHFLCIMMQLKELSIRYTRQSDWYKEIQFLYDYYQPLWKTVCTLKHGEVIEYLITKIFINTFEIKMFEVGEYVEFQFVCDHFIRLYFENNPFLGEDQINKQIILLTLDCKEDQKKIHEHQLYFELIKSLNKSEKFHKSNDYMVVVFRRKLKTFIDQMTDTDFMKPLLIWNHMPLMKFIVQPLTNNLPSLLSIDQLIAKCKKETLIELAKLKEGHEKKDSLLLQIENVLIKKGLIQNNKQQDSPDQFFKKYGDKKYVIIQQKYFSASRDINFFQRFKECIIKKIQIFGALLFTSPQFGFGYFRLSHRQLSLPQKISSLLLCGIDPYFSRYTKENITDKSVTGIWQTLLNRMIKEQISFLGALKTQLTANFAQFETIFAKSVTDEYENIQRLLANRFLQIDETRLKKDKISIYKFYIGCVKKPTSIVNLHLIIDLIKMINNRDAGIKIQKQIDIVFQFFQRNIDIFSRALAEAEGKIKRGEDKQKQTENVKTKQVQLQNYLRKWIPIILSLRGQVLEQDIIKQYLIPMIKQAANRKIINHCKQIVRFVSLKMIFTEELSFTKMRFMDNPGDQYLQILIASNSEQFEKWFGFCTGQGIGFYEHMNKEYFSKAFSSFPYPCQLKIIHEIIGRIIRQDLSKILRKKSGISFETKNQMVIFQVISTLYKPISSQHKIEAFLALKNIKQIQDYIKNLIKPLLFEARNVNLTSAGLILMDSSSQFDFYLLNKENKINKYDTLTFYSKCSDSQYQAYINNLSQLHQQSFNQSFHLQKVISTLIQAQQWTRLQKMLNIKSIEARLVELIFNNLYHSSNRILKLRNADCKNIIESLFKIMQKNNIKPSDELFAATYYADCKQSLKMIPKILSIGTLSKCIKQNPENSSEFLKAQITVDIQNFEEQSASKYFSKLSRSLKIRCWLPIIPHNSWDKENRKRIIDELRLECYIYKQLREDKSIYYKNIESMKNKIDLVPFRKQFFEQEEYLNTICKGILLDAQNTSFKVFTKQIPILKQRMQKYLFSKDETTNKKGRCINLQMINKNILIQLINDGYLFSSEPKSLYSCFIRVIDTANLDIIDLFMSKNNLTISQTYLKELEQYYNFSFLSHLFSICNEPFLINFIRKYKIFDLYSLEQFSPLLLMIICTYRFNKLLQFTINWVQTKTKAKATFVAQIVQNSPQITQTGIFYLPVQRSIQFNFYECYFLINQSGNESPKFTLSDRFLSKVDPSQWNYLPQFKRRVEINNALMETIRECEQKQFRQNVILPNIFQLQGSDVHFFPRKSYKGSLCKFICDFSQGDFNVLLREDQENIGVFQKLSLMIFSQNKTGIPIAQLQKLYPSQMKIVNKLQPFLPKDTIQIDLNLLFRNVPQFKAHLLLYRPQQFLEDINNNNVDQLLGRTKNTLDCISYLKGIQVNFLLLQQKYRLILEQYIINCFFNQTSAIENVNASSYLKRHALKLILFDISEHNRQFQSSFIFQTIKEAGYWRDYTDQRAIYEIAKHLNNRGNNEMCFDLMVWNKLIEQINETQQYWNTLQIKDLNQYQIDDNIKKRLIDAYNFISPQQFPMFEVFNTSEVFTALFTNQIDKINVKSIFIELSLLMNACLLEFELIQFKEKLNNIKGSGKIVKFRIRFVSKIQKSIVFINQTQIQLQVMYSLSKHESGKLCLIQLNFNELLEDLRYELYFLELQEQAKLQPLNNYCSEGNRHTFFKDYRFITDINSFKTIKDISIVENILDYDPTRMQSDGVTSKVMNQIERMEEKLAGSRSIKLYSSSDIFGPINFAEQLNDNKIIECLSFYELIALPKDNPVIVSFISKPQISKQTNLRILNHIKLYLNYYIRSSKEDSPQKIDIDNTIQVYLREGKDKDMRMELNWSQFGAWSICELVCLVLNYCSDISTKIEKILDIRLSYLSLVKYYQQYLEIQGILGIKEAVGQLIMQNQMSTLVETILLMITQDVRNIMKIVKGIILQFTINSSEQKKANIIISNFVSATSVSYQVKENLLHVIIHLQMKKDLNKKDAKGDQPQSLVSRKQFLDSVFISAQFLTDYFLAKNQLHSECITISTSITKKLNSTINFHIEFNNLYKYIDEMRKQSSIKDIELFLNRLKHYLITGMDRSINLYLSSNDLANRHQILLLNKCEAINNDMSLEKINNIKQLVYQSHEKQRPNGLEEIEGLMNEVGNSQILKNTFLIQIYKSYYSTMVAEGMTFVVGYKSNKKKAQVIAITKAENINEINIIEVDYILLVSRTIPSNDELNQSKIIRIFVTDYNKVLYKINQKLKDYFLNLPEESQDRKIADFAPIIPSNIKLQFYTNSMKHQADSKDTKLFFVNLGSESKLKMLPQPDRILTPINILKRSIQFKEAIQKIQEGFRSFFKENVSITIDPPLAASAQTNINYAHFIHLIAMDIIELIGKFQYEPMRNQSIDCHLSIEKGFALNQNGVVELRKRCFVQNFRKIRIRIRQQESEVVTFNENEININISLLNTSSLPSSSDYLSSILQELIKRQKKILPKQVIVSSQIKHESSERLLKLLDIIILVHIQIEQLTTAVQLISILYHANLENYRIHVDRKKAQINFAQKQLTLSFNFEMPEREFYSSENILTEYIRWTNPNIEMPHEHLMSYYCPIQKAIFVEQTAKNIFNLVYLDANGKWILLDKVKGIFVGNEMRIELPQKIKQSSKFLLIQESSHIITSNYYYELKEASSIVSTKNALGLIGRQQSIYLKSKKPINLNFNQISIIKRDPIQKVQTANNNLLHHQLRNIITVCLASKNVYLLLINSSQSTILTVQYGGNNNLLNSDIESTILTISSDGELNLSNTKFVELQIWKKKPLAIKQKENDSVNLSFRQPSETTSEQSIEIRQNDKNNVQNLVYVVNDECKKFLTRAGEERVDYIMFCDSNNNPLNYDGLIDVFFLHINKLAIIKPKVQKKNMQFGLRWSPIVRGHYYMYINNVRMNPTYEIGVCAAQADHLISKVTPPKIRKICYCEESEIMLDLRDSFGNIYSQLQQEMIGDELLIDIETDKLKSFLKMQKSQINKYGLKKVKFHFNKTENDAPTDVFVQILLNREKICEFVIKIEGYSLTQRKKLLDGQIAKKDKRFQREITVSRNRFLEDLFTLAEKSLHANLRVKFVGEPGIDAGGVKRQFYDLVGNEMKSESNPFFKLVNKSKMEYFLNPDLIKNKKKLQYMELWGKYVANSLLNNYLVGISFSPVFVKLLYEYEVSYQDLLDVLPEEERRQYMYLLTASPEQFQDLGLYFTVMVDRKKCLQIQLKPEGKQIPVTAENVKSYLELTSQALLSNRYKQLINAFKKGFETVLELPIFTKWIRPTEFWCLTAGNKQITPQLVLNYIVFQGSGIDNISGWFRRYISESNHEVLVGFLKFSSGSSSIDFSMSSKVTVTFENAGQNPKKLPISHTCWKQIVVPKYKNYDIMKKLLTAAFIYCSEGFGFG